MGKTGQYSKSRRSITEPVIKIPDNIAQVPRLDEETREDVEKVAADTVKKLDKDRYVLQKRTGWLIATLVVTVLGATAYLGSSFFTRGHQVDHLQEQVRNLNGEVEEDREARQVLERRVVELETQIELMQEQETPSED